MYLMPATRPLRERFEEKIDRDGPVVSVELGPCWDWTAGASPRGYGVMGCPMPGDSRARRLATHVSLFFATGEWAEGRYALHRCDRRICVRPDHLYWGTLRDNTQDMLRRERSSYHRYPELYSSEHRATLDKSSWDMARGSRNNRAKLTEEDVVAIKAQIVAGMTDAAIAATCAVSRTAIASIRYKRTWNHVAWPCEYVPREFKSCSRRLDRPFKGVEIQANIGVLDGSPIDPDPAEFGEADPPGR